MIAAFLNKCCATARDEIVCKEYRLAENTAINTVIASTVDKRFPSIALVHRWHTRWVLRIVIVCREPLDACCRARRFVPKKIISNNDREGVRESGKLD